MSLIFIRSSQYDRILAALDLARDPPEIDFFENYGPRGMALIEALRNRGTRTDGLSIQRYGALRAIKNGARLWTVDHIGVKTGQERDFQGLKARWVMWFPIPAALRTKSATPTTA